MSQYQFHKDRDPNKVYIISAVPSIDTSVCDKETRRFNEEASKIGDDIEILTISVDLPFALKRWSAAKGIDKVKTMSDHKDTSFGMAYGVLVKDLRILSRCVFVIDKDGVIKHIEMVNDISNEPDYDSIINKAKKYI
jgi:thiol peroxidase